MADESSERERIEKLVRDHVQQISEHVDSVRVFVTHHEGNKSQTAAFTYGAGNFYASIGQVWEWLIRKRREIEAEETNDD